MNRFKELRIEKGYSQKELADILFVNQTAVSQWERDVTTPTKETLMKLCDLYSTTIDYLLGRTDINRFESDSNDNITPKEKKLFDLYQKAKNSDDPRDNAVADAVEKLLGLNE